jgi:hypothetical protein
MYRWKQELAGRKVKCKCGQVMVAPEAPPAIETPEDDDLFGLASSAEIPAPPRPLPAVATTGAAPAVPVLPYRTPPREERAAKAIEGAPAKDFYIPLALVLIGTLVEFGYFMSLAPHKTTDLAAASVMVGVSVAASVCVMLIGCLIATKAGMGFGHPLQAILKLAAIGIVVSAIEHVVGYLAGVSFVGWGVSLLAYFGLFMWLFDLDLSEAKLVVFIIWGLNIVMNAFLFAAIVSMFLR